MTWKIWLQGLTAAAAGGAISAVSSSLMIPGIKGSDIAKTSLVTALATALSFLNQSPIPSLPAPQAPPAH